MAGILKAGILTGNILLVIRGRERTQHLHITEVPVLIAEVLIVPQVEPIHAQGLYQHLKIILALPVLLQVQIKAVHIHGLQPVPVQQLPIAGLLQVVAQAPIASLLQVVRPDLPAPIAGLLRVAVPVLIADLHQAAVQVVATPLQVVGQAGLQVVQAAQAAQAAQAVQAVQAVQAAQVVPAEVVEVEDNLVYPRVQGVFLFHFVN